jgi:hypothetical protein
VAQPLKLNFRVGVPLKLRLRVPHPSVFKGAVFEVDYSSPLLPSEI